MTIPTVDDAHTLQQNTRHPLDPLTVEEVTQTTSILRASGRLTPRMRLMAYSLQEAPKNAVLAFQAGQPVPRHRVPTPSCRSLASKLVGVYRQGAIL
jgi:Cu2+-containing amine oxidase